MKLKARLVAPVAACAFVATGMLGAGAAQAAVPVVPVAAGPAAHVAQGVAQLSLQQLTELVTLRVHLEYPNAKLMLADGSAPGGRTQDVSKVTDWRFVFNTADRQSAVKSVQVKATLNGEVGPLTTYRAPWGGVAAIDGPTYLSPAQAYDILKRAGHGDAYQYVSLVKPLVAKPHLQYHFSNIRGGCDGYAVNVDDQVVNPICG
ncbi:hypothetical protein [Streptomyces cinnamoneus]|uniref:Secreted protein n=1 Tax=Streptomyces cinnamoneus TaxID=53446 RepID=A0A918TZA3_STRCJ|nr:hypothetical protein [Streptomyces cinnamoneus]GHC70458.1 hypothetical protein GCM10010507_56590 [Streptomyces cinnamoneus]